jgi:hypothetical protein
MKRCSGGIYLIRTRKHHVPFGLPIIGRHNGYVGKSKVYSLRWKQHLKGGGTYRSVAKEWADLDPMPIRLIPLPRLFTDTLPWVMTALEALCIWVLLPVYNDKLNRHNPRRVPLAKQRVQRALRDTSPRWTRWFAYLARMLAKVVLVSGSLWIIYKIGVFS